MRHYFSNNSQVKPRAFKTETVLVQCRASDLCVILKCWSAASKGIFIPVSLWPQARLLCPIPQIHAISCFLSLVKVILNHCNKKHITCITSVAILIMPHTTSQRSIYSWYSLKCAAWLTCRVQPSVGERLTKTRATSVAWRAWNDAIRMQRSKPPKLMLPHRSCTVRQNELYL